VGQPDVLLNLLQLLRKGFLACCLSSNYFWLPPEPETAPTYRNPNQNRAAHERIFESNKSAPANRQTGFYANRDPKKQEVGFIFA
jgi:hypothetical protein